MKTLQVGRGSMRSMAMMAATLVGLAPVPGPVLPSASAGPEINRTQSQARQSMQATPTATRSIQYQANASGGMDYYGSGKYSDLFTFPNWNQRKARKKARHVGSKNVKKRWSR